MVEHPIDHLLHKCASAIPDRRVMQSIARNAWRYIDELRSTHPHLCDEELARTAVQRVLAEARSYPPASAIVVRVANRAPESATETGIWSEEAMAVVLHWVNRADFTVQFKQVTGSISVSTWMPSIRSRSMHPSTSKSRHAASNASS
jgi:hypothetical protein